MNKFILLFFLASVLISFSAFSQESTPFGYFNTNISFSKTKDIELYQNFIGSRVQEINTLNFSITPSVNKFISNTLAVGAGIGYSKNKNSTYLFDGNQFTDNDYKRIESIISPFVMVEKFLTLSDKLSFTGIGYIFGHYSNVQTEYYMYDVTSGITSSYSTEVKRSSFEISLNPSLRYDLFREIGLQLIFGRLSYEQSLNDSSINDNYEVRENELQLDFSPQNWQVGFFYKL